MPTSQDLKGCLSKPSTNIPISSVYTNAPPQEGKHYHIAITITTLLISIGLILLVNLNVVIVITYSLVANHSSTKRLIVRKSLQVVREP